jgi:general secretion pathway protein C
MVTNLQNRWAVAGATFLLWALVAGCAVYWAMKMAARSGGLPVAAVVSRAPAAADPAALARLLGANPAVAGTAPVPSAASRFTLAGVAASASQHGVALIAVDGKPAKPFRVGAAVDEGLVLQSVAPRRAVLAPSAGGPAVVTLELPLPRKDPPAVR